MTRPRLAPFLAAAALGLAACVGYRPTTLQQIGVGDDVRVHTVDGSALTFEVETLGRRALGGDGLLVPVEHIERLEVRERTATGHVLVGLTNVKQYAFFAAIGVTVVVVLIAL